MLSIAHTIAQLQTSQHLAKVEIPWKKLRNQLCTSSRVQSQSRRGRVSRPLTERERLQHGHASIISYRSARKLMRVDVDTDASERQSHTQDDVVSARNQSIETDYGMFDDIHPTVSPSATPGERKEVMRSALHAKRERRSGWENYFSFLYALNCIDSVIPRSAQQRRIHTEAAKTLLRIFFSPKEFQQNMSSIISFFSASEKLEQELFVVANRRFGKTYSISMLAAALLFAVPCIRIAIFGTTKRLTSMLVQYTRSFLQAIPEVSVLGIEASQERITIGKAFIRAYPSGLQVRRVLGLVSSLVVSPHPV